LVFSRLPDVPKEYVQDRMLVQGDKLTQLLKSEHTHIYICGLKNMEKGVESAFDTICGNKGMNWETIKGAMRKTGRYHVETY